MHKIIIKLIDFLYFCYFKKMNFLRGALTSKPYSFVARPWEFKSIESVDFFDSIGAAVRFDVRGDKIVRILPRLEEDINEEWISDKTRFSVDGFRIQRIDTPLINIDQHFRLSNWVNAISFITNLLSKTRKLDLSLILNLGQIRNQGLSINYFNNFFSDFENEVWLNFMMNGFFFKKGDVNLIKNTSLRENFLFNFKIKEIQDYNSLILVDKYKIRVASF